MPNLTGYNISNFGYFLFCLHEQNSVLVATSYFLVCLHEQNSVLVATSYL